ncbi:DUF2569 family protein [Pontibacter sp. BT310]|uniref:DUF2569 domain-containing protein n=1 Tax=Pontibacter populi TaxID=890055 RepID=A0ABS6XAC3_9BACT|nr:MULTISPECIES: DUF2569 family protein [Pontibacter]MBJ6118104.1 DUF2569 family protein [Pontibacter sp. BT310]MBR0570531.1 DUF2569 family protein [Microvirga sp. STS03]MBW3364957.1 DUF2569 domain-containing protein [Pontibacter populi]
MKSILNENAFEDEGSKTGYGLWLYLLLFMVGINGVKAAMTLIQNASLDLVNLVYAVLLAFIAIATTIGFFARKRWTPMLFISFFVLNLLYIFYISIALAANYPDQIDYFSLVRVVVMCLLVIPYMLRSERVREVFAN